MAAFDFSSSFAGLNSALSQLGQAVREGRDTDALLAAYDASQGPQALAPLAQPAPAGAAAPGGSLRALGQGDYFTRTRSAESSGNDAAKNPASTATGRYQFLDGTWNGLMKSNPELGLTADGRSDPQQQERAMRAFTAQNADALRAKGVDPSDRNLYMAHFLGAGAAPNFINAVQQDPSVPAASLVRPEVVAANRGVFLNQDGTPRTAGEVYARMTNRFGDGSTAVAQNAADLPAPGAAQAQGFAVPQGAQPASRQSVNPQMLRALLANPSTRDIGKQLWAQALGKQQFGFQVVGDQLYRTNPTTGQAEPIGVTNPKASLDMEKARIDIEKGKRELMGEGATPLTPEERQQYGIPTDQPAYKTRSGEIKFGPAGTKIINEAQKGETKFSEELGKAQAKRWDGYITEGDVAQGRLADIQQLREASRNLGTQGSSANLKALVGPYAESLGIKIDGLSDIQLYESITQRLAPQLRATGSGSTSDIEFKGFLRAIGPLSNTPAAREMILDTFEAASRNDLARAEIATRLATGEISRGQAERDLRALPNPMDGFKKFREANPDLVGQAIKQSALRQAAEGRAPVKVASPEEARKLPSGSRIILPDGRQGQVP